MTTNCGCHGGYPSKTYAFITKNGGIDSEAYYPYENDHGKCHFNTSARAATVTGYVQLPLGDENKLAEAVATIGPVSVLILAVGFEFHHYTGGVYHNPDCDSWPGHFNHAVLVVGYGTDMTEGKDYWLVKNSWNAHWGVDGYIKMSRNNGNNCGIASAAVYPTV